MIIILSYVPAPPLSFSNQANEPVYQRTSEKIPKIFNHGGRFY